MTSKFNFNTQQIILISKHAGQIARKYFHSEVSISKKPDESPVTQADIEISEYLESELPKIINVPVLSEEQPDSNDYLNWTQYWLIDPIDGTKDFINKTNDFCVCIAFIDNNVSVFGCIYSPMTDEIFIAENDKGAFLVAKNQSICLNEKFFGNININHLTVTISAEKASGRMLDFLSIIPNYSIYRRGSALKYTDIAQGKANIYPKLWDTYEWDTAAAQVILEQSGGKLINFSGNSLQYGKRHSLINPHFIAYRYVDDKLIELLLKKYKILDCSSITK